MRKEKLRCERTSKFWKMYLNQTDDVWGCADPVCPATESAPESSSTLKRALNQRVLHQWDYLTEASSESKQGQLLDKCLPVMVFLSAQLDPLSYSL